MSDRRTLRLASTGLVMLGVLTTPVVLAVGGDATAVPPLLAVAGILGLVIHRPTESAPAAEAGALPTE